MQIQYVPIDSKKSENLKINSVKNNDLFKINNVYEVNRLSVG